jgi:uracil-DNA glycosylase
MDITSQSWVDLLDPIIRQPWFDDLSRRVTEARAAGIVYPPPELQYAALALPPDRVRVIILGQDPYHGAGQAMGLSFSVPPGVRPPPSLANIFREVEAETGRPSSGRSGDLTPWRDQGVLLLNSVLTVAAGQPGSHRGWGWERFTSALLETLLEKRPGLVVMLWGKDAAAKSSLVDPSRHLLLVSPHPSPYSAHTGFFGNGHFQAANAYLSASGHLPIEW